jgi:hypothetical protein
VRIAALLPRTADRRRQVAVLACALAASTVACTADDEPATATGCAATVREASLAVEVDEQVALLDDAFSRCVSAATLTAEMDRYPGIVGYSAPTFVALRCRTTTDQRLLTSAVCSSINAPATTVVAVTVDVVFVAETLDGRRIEIRPDADTPFVGDVPESVQRTVDVAIEAGCAGVIEQRDLWAAQVADPVIADEASAYANHAQNVANYIGCVFEPIGT